MPKSLVLFRTSYTEFMLQYGHALSQGKLIMAYEMNVPQIARIMVMGAKGSGKSTFIQSVSELEVTPLKVSLPDTIEMEYGQIIVTDELCVQLITPKTNAVPFDAINSIWRNATRDKGYMGHIIVVDCTDPDHYPAARLLIETCYQQSHAPLVVVATHSDRIPGQLDRTALRRELDVPSHISIIPCNATDVESAENVLMQLMYEIIDLQIQEERESVKQ